MSSPVWLHKGKYRIAEKQGNCLSVTGIFSAFIMKSTEICKSLSCCLETHLICALCIPPPPHWQTISLMLSIIRRYLLISLSTPAPSYKMSGSQRQGPLTCPSVHAPWPCCVFGCNCSGRCWDWNHLWGAKSQRPDTPVGPVQWGGNILSNWTWTLLKWSSAPHRKWRCSGLPTGVTLSRRDLTQCPVSDGELLLTPGFKPAALVGGWSLRSLQHRCTLKVVGFRVSDGRMWVSCPRVQKSTGSNVPNSLSFPSCVFHVFQPHFCKYL